MVEYPEDTGFCSGNSKATIFRHAVQLGPYCDPGTGAGARFLFNAPVVVCADQISQFELLNEFAINTGTKNDRYTCTKSATFPSGSTASETKTIPRLGILTSFNWAISPSYGICYKVGGTNSSASLAPTPAVAQTSATPSASLSHVPSSPSPVRSPLGLIMLPSEPTRNPALPPQSAPSQPSASTSSVQDKSSSSSSSADGPSVGAVVGGAIAALVCLCIIALVIVRRKSSRGSSPRGQNKGLGNNVDNNEDRPPTTDTDRNIEGLFPQRQLDFVAKQSIVAPSSRVTTKKNGVDNDMATAASATTASATASSAHDQSGSSQTPRYKDQVRPAVWDPTPLVNATALGDLDSPDIQVAQLVAVEPVPTVPTVVATSPEQNARRRPAAEPAGHHVDEPRDDDDDDMPTVN